MTVRTHDPRAITLLYGGRPIDGFGEDSFVSVEKAEDGYSSKTGCDGFITRSRMASNLHKGKFTLLAKSPSNAYLSACYNADRAAPNGIVLPILIRDQLGTASFFALEAWITKPAPWEAGKTEGQCEWEWEADMVEGSIVGGS